MIINYNYFYQISTNLLVSKTSIYCLIGGLEEVVGNEIIGIIVCCVWAKYSTITSCISTQYVWSAVIHTYAGELILREGMSRDGTVSLKNALYERWTRLNEWLNRTNEWMNKWIEWINEWIEWMNRTNEWINEWIKWLNE